MGFRAKKRSQQFLAYEGRGEMEHFPGNSIFERGLPGLEISFWDSFHRGFFNVVFR